MPLIHALATIAAAIGAPPASDAELAAATPRGSPPVVRIAGPDRAGPAPVAEIVDHWWRTTGMAMIAAGARPLPAVAWHVDPDAIRDGHLAFRFTTTPTATTHP
ncbi:MAG: hypothetical protein DI544_09265 [Sphingomonas taxi]|uniref:Uncharacterized protein n=1 Tax=Sphingomonas taxi TaxID=1549858 RepID=A0A2W5P487_9SPHN|nr:MAG: hypothetical protein DI544_09265 [Sphingomonas taxi]